MFILSESKKSLDPNLVINRAMLSMNTHNLASSTGQSGEGKSFLVSGDIDGVPYLFIVISFNHVNDIYETDELIMNEEDIDNIWHEGIVFLEEIGFYLDDVDIVSVKEDFNIFKNLGGSLDEKTSNAIHSDEESDEIINYFTSF
jgi:hypothetical protein